MDVFTDKQNEEVKKLMKEVKKTAIWLGIKQFVRLALMCSAVIVANQYLVKNDIFVVLMSLVSGICSSVISKEEIRVTNEGFRQRIKEIAENK